jgi:hypothetical protein
MYTEIYKNMMSKQARPVRDPNEPGTMEMMADSKGNVVVPNEGGAMKQMNQKELINSMYKQAAQELGITDGWWKDQRVANRAYELLKEYNKNSQLPNKYSPNSSGVRPGGLNPELGAYVEFQRPNTVKPGSVNPESGVYVEYRPEANLRLSDLYKSAKEPDTSVSWEFF